MTVFLLDANVLIAIGSHEHIHHERAVRWAATLDIFAVCPIVEGALVRFAVRMGASSSSVQRALVALRERPGYQFWPDNVSYADADLSSVRGHKQVTDAYLVALASSYEDGMLATMDERLAHSTPERVHLVPGFPVGP